MEEKEEEGLFDKVGTTDHEMPTVLKVGARRSDSKLEGTHSLLEATIGDQCLS